MTRKPKLLPCRKCGFPAALRVSEGCNPSLIYCTNHGACCPVIKSENDDTDIALMVEMWNYSTKPAMSEDEAVELAKNDPACYAAVMSYGNDQGGTPREIFSAFYRALTAAGMTFMGGDNE